MRVPAGGGAGAAQEAGRPWCPREGEQSEPALPSCHGNEQTEVGGRRRRRVGRRDGEEAAAGGREPASAALEPPRSRASAGGNAGGQAPGPGARPSPRPPPRSRRRAADPPGSGLAQRGPRALDALGLVPRRAQVGISMGTAGAGCPETQGQRPLCLPAADQREQAWGEMDPGEAQLSRTSGSTVLRIEGHPLFCPLSRVQAHAHGHLEG